MIIGASTSTSGNITRSGSTQSLISTSQQSGVSGGVSVTHKHSVEMLTRLFGADKALPIVWDIYSRGNTSVGSCMFCDAGHHMAHLSDLSLNLHLPRIHVHACLRLMYLSHVHISCLMCHVSCHTPAKQHEEFYSLSELALADYSYALRFIAIGDCFWRRALLIKRRGHARRALSDVSHAITLTREDQSYTMKSSVPTSNYGTLQTKLHVYHLVRAMLHYQLADYTSCVADCTDVLRIHVKNVAAYRQRSMAYTQLCEYDAAIEDLEVYCELKEVSVCVSCLAHVMC